MLSVMLNYAIPKDLLTKAKVYRAHMTVHGAFDASAKLYNCAAFDID